jgi:methionyl aminopeptidase
MSFLEEVEIMKEGGGILVGILKKLKQEVRVGKRASELNELAEKLIYQAGAESAFKNYKPDFAKKPYPYSLCVSINEVIVHGFPTKDLIIKNSNIVKLDLGIKFKGYYTDAAITIGVADISEKNKKLIEATRKALQKAFMSAKAGNTFGDISWQIESTITDYGFKPIKNLCGHDIGKFLHGDLQILNYGEPGTGEKIKPGMTFTIEPMASVGSEFATQENDFIFKTEDNSFSAHFEATIAVLENETIILTPIFDII